MKKQYGFTLLELAVVLAILALMAIASTPKYIEEIQERRATIAIQETQMILDAARVYRVKNSGVWPGAAAGNCLSAISVMKEMSPPLLVGDLQTNKFGNSVATSCTADMFSIDQAIVKDWDGYVMNGLPATTLVSASTYRIRTTIGSPGSEPALYNKLSRNAEANAELNRMRTNLLMSNFNITEINNLSAVAIDASGPVTAQSVTARGDTSVGGSLWVTGNQSVNGSSQVTGNELISGSSQIGGNQAVYGDSQVSGTQTVLGSSKVSGDHLVDGELQLGKVVSSGAACKTPGALARLSSGSPMYCMNGAWTAMGGISEPTRVSGNSLGAWKLCTLNYGSGNSKSLTYSNGQWYYSGSGTQVVYCYQ
ncbi:prepilin-type N-terminal cleavage/methylation domain-containing protein [Pseudomonas sp. 165]|uniref:Prepilin-type N-terminal cleavage/methylation domain-containing protein n=1 Tax=Pseudomonas juntendi TaxID=2666183 RepID=A0AAJ5S7B3_9PSED|nr:MULTISPECIES: prepilin-type N-terminal cleavage/methylation domain-containing protein [Pseudomonas]MDM1714707.1 prepilin-type N-terminal cleavage/methylation domain-containing protein [Pseudomonas sp. 165]WEA23189.1 prepilin-type N-terminal cleavage/methylation domain-containing protein [Pseudomonas juntendi]